MGISWLTRGLVTAATLLIVFPCAQLQPGAAQGPGTSLRKSTTHPLNMIALFAYRTSDTEAISQEKKVAIVPNKPTEFTMGKFKIFAQRSENAYDAPSLFINVSEAKTGKLISHTLYQYGNDLRNLFAGEHGFTGLNYVYHPQGQAELQFTCAVAP